MVSLGHIESMHHIERGSLYFDSNLLHFENIYLYWILLINIVEAEMSQKLSWRDLFAQIELGVDIASLGIK